MSNCVEVYSLIWYIVGIYSVFAKCVPHWDCGNNGKTRTSVLAWSASAYAGSGVSGGEMRFALTLWRHYLFMNFFWIKYNTIVIFCQFKNSYCLQNCKRAQITCKNIPLSYHVLYNAHKYADKKTINMPDRNLASFSSMLLLLHWLPRISVWTHMHLLFRRCVIWQSISIAWDTFD